MNHSLRSLLALVALGVRCACAAGGIAAVDAQVQTAGADASTAVVSVVLRNDGDREVKLVKADSPFATAVEFHASTGEAGEGIRMRAISQIVIAAHREIALKSHDTHLMLVGLKRPLSPGELVPVLLTFDSGQTVKIDAKVLEATAEGR